MLFINIMTGNTIYSGDFVHFPALGSAQIFHDYVLGKFGAVLRAQPTQHTS